jgi:hypothetical protein
MADVFVSYAQPDREAAFRIAEQLEAQGVSCWIAPRDVPPGAEYGQAIIDAIEGAKALVLTFSEAANESQFVRREVERAVSKTKPIFPVRVREAQPSGALEFFISGAQWVDAFKTPLERSLAPIVSAAQALGGARMAAKAPGRPRSQIDKRRVAFIAGLALGLAAIGASGFWWTHRQVDAVAFVSGVWCERVDGVTWRIDMSRTGADTARGELRHPQSDKVFDFEVRVSPIEGGYEFVGLDEESAKLGPSRFQVLDDNTMKLVWGGGEPRDGPVRTRCGAS